MLSKLNENKAKEQALVISRLASNGFCGTYVGATAVGKTKIGCDVADIIIKKSLSFNKEPKILIVVPTQNLRDNEWVNELINWGYKDNLKYIEIQCIQTVYKYEHKDYDLVILDELHALVSEQYSLLLKNNTFECIIGLTATIEDEIKKQIVDHYCPVVHETSIDRALSLGLISPFKIYNLAVPLTKEEDTKLKSINYLYGKASNTLGGRFEAFDNAQIYRQRQYKDSHKELYEASVLFWAQMQYRRKLLINATNKALVAKDIVDKFPDRQTLLFSESISSAENVSNLINKNKEIPISTVYYASVGKNKKIDREANLEAFIEPNNNIRVLSTVKALNAGLNIPRCSLGICLAGSSKSLDDIQRRGRICRLDDKDPTKVALYVNLFIPETQEQTWLEKRIKSSDLANISWITSVSQIQI